MCLWPLKVPTQNSLMLNSVAEECVDDSLVKILKLRFGRDFEFELWT